MFKKIILAALVVGTAAFAQINAKLGGNAAFTLGSTWGENSDKIYNGWGPGFAGGLNVKIEINPSISIISGLGFEYRCVPSDVIRKGLFDIVKKAAKQELGRDVDMAEIRYQLGSELVDMISNVDASFSFKYIDIPLLVRYNVNPEFFMEGGLSIGFNLGADMSMSYESNSRSLDVPSKYRNTIEVGAVLGVGYSVLPNLDLNFRFDLGLTDMVKGRETLANFFSEAGEDSEIFNSYLESNYGFKNMRFQMGLTFWFM